MTSDTAKPTDHDRVLTMDAIHNFRDHGGYARVGGGRLKRGLLFRSAQHRDASGDDLAKVSALGLATVIDLRSDGERMRDPCPRPEGFAAEVWFAGGDTTGHAVHVEAGRGVETEAEAHEAMRRTYAGMVLRPNLAKIFARYFAELAENKGPSLIHCFAGKDRTGVGVAVLHKLCGVHHDDMIADYLLTNTAGNSEARIAAGFDVVSKGGFRARNMDAVRKLMSAHEDFLDAAFATVSEKFGSVEAYAEQMLGVTPAMRERIIASLSE